jgi:TPR repeat protein
MVSPMTPTLLRLIFGSIALTAATTGLCLDAEDAVNKAEAQLTNGEHTLARSYLEPALIDPRLSPEARAHAYYMRGYSFQKDRLFVSAAADYHRALEFDPTNATVMSALASLHVDGLGADALPTVARALLLRAAESGAVEAGTLLGYLSLRGIGVKADPAAAREWFEDAAAAGSARAMLELANTYRRPWTDPPDGIQALHWLERAAAAGLPRAWTIAGYMAERGELASPPGEQQDADATDASGTPDARRARAFFEQAAAAGDALAQAKLAHMLLDGVGGARATGRAFDLFTAAAGQGLTAGFSGLAYLYEAGIGTRQNLELARHWRERAAEAGDLDAQRHLAIDARARKDSAGLARWLSKAAAQKDLWALNAYAWMLSTAREPSSRDGTRALLYAQRAVALRRSASHLDTLAAASAETGQFTAAVELQREALRLVPAETESAEARAALRAELEERLATYQQGRPWREPDA